MTNTNQWHRLSAIDRDRRTAECSVCGPTSIRYRPSPRSSTCQSVVKATERRRMEKSGERRSAQRREQRLRQNYDLSESEYEGMLKKQAGGCAICGAGPTSRALAVDHCHQTGRVRGILCTKCNTALGLLGDLVGVESARSYLMKPS